MENTWVFSCITPCLNNVFVWKLDSIFLLYNIGIKKSKFTEVWMDVLTKTIKFIHMKILICNKWNRFRGLELLDFLLLLLNAGKMRKDWFSLLYPDFPRLNY